MTTTKRNTAVVVLAAGLGTRMKSALPKVLHRVAGVPMIAHVMAALRDLRPSRVTVVIGPGMDAVAKAVAPAVVAIQAERRGTAHAVMAARDSLKGFEGDIVVVNGDAPLLQGATLRRLARTRAKGRRPGIVMLAMRPADPSGYGRLVLGADGGLERIVEHRDASTAERAIDLCYAGMLAGDAASLWTLLDRVRPNNVKKEYYLTDVVALAREAGIACGHAEGAADELIGVNSRAELAAAEVAMQARLRGAAMANGVTLVDPGSVYLCADTRLASDVVIGPGVIFGPGVSVASGSEIRGFCHIEGARIAGDAVIGPFARIRPTTVVGKGAHIGNFVEVKNARIAPGAKMNHLSYLGDASIGAKANIGAGTITCNYDGYVKSRTAIGAGAFIGSDTALVAPVRVGARAITGAGSVIVRDVPADSLAVGRGAQVNKPGWARAFRERRSRTAKKG